MAVVRWSYGKFKLWAVLYYPTADGFLPLGLDVSRAETTFGLNELPTCTLSVAVGREAVTGLPSLIHQAANDMRISLPVQVWLEAIELTSSYGAPVVAWPAGPFPIFEGYTTGLGFTKNRAGQAGFNLACQHWLTDLNFSSALSRTSHVGNPAHYYNPAGIELAGTGVQPGGKSFVASTLGTDAFTAAVVTTDMWAGLDAGQGILGFLLRLTEQDLLQVRELNIQPGRTSNFEARAALSRFEPVLENAYVFGVPLALRNDDVDASAAIHRAIAEDITNETLDASASVTLWDKLAGDYRSHFLYSVVPTVDRALVVPFLPGLRYWWQTIYAEDYDTIRADGELPRALRGVGVFTGMPSGAGAFGPAVGQSQAVPTIGGYYENPDLPGGTVQFFQGPPWLSRVQGSGLHGFYAAAPAGVVGTSMFPGEGEASPVPPPIASQAQAHGMLNGLARALYLEQVLQGRVAVLKGRPRFDIAPGSTVEVVVSEEKFVTATLGYASSAAAMYGTAVRLTTVLDAEAPEAYTNVMLAHLRSDVENGRDSTSIGFNPLWRHTWAGAPLVSHGAFLPRPNPFFGAPP